MESEEIRPGEPGLEPAIATGEGMPSPASVGAMLAVARKNLGLSVFEVSDRLHLTEHYVRAIEADDYTKLPGEVFVKGYLKSYALLVGLDPEQIRGAYRGPAAPVRAMSEPVRQQPARFSQNWFLLLLLFILAGVIGSVGWWAWQTFAAFSMLPAATQKTQNTKKRPGHESP